MSKRSLVDLDGVDEPVDVVEHVGVLSNVVRAGRRAGSAGAELGPDVTGPVTTESDIEDLAEVSVCSFLPWTALTIFILLKYWVKSQPAKFA